MKDLARAYEEGQALQCSVLRSPHFKRSGTRILGG